MLFNSAEFLFLFLPLVLLSFHLAQRYLSVMAALRILVIASLFFYGWWQPIYLCLLIFSMLGNFYLAKFIYIYKSKTTLIAAISMNLASIVYYKYSNFFVENISVALGQTWQVEQLILPLAISFFTFQQIAYIVDVYKKGQIEHSLTNYILFVTFFPQLIAGPIVHHGTIMPQFADRQRVGINLDQTVIGLSIFSIGLFKKTVLADNIAVYSNPIFNNVDSGQLTPDFFLAWGGALAYTAQLYFDFSGYSDMAIGLGLLFGISLPLNFNSPYKAINIIEFWRRWHITLSHFLRDYLYIALGGNRLGALRRYFNLFLTMLLGGLWHGAGWNFLIWGALHGVYLIANHGFTAIRIHLDWKASSKIALSLSWLITFVAVVVGWVFFRAATLDGAIVMLKGMIGLNGVSLPEGILARIGDFALILQSWGVTASIGGGKLLIQTWLWSIGLLLIAVLAPNVHDLFYNYLKPESKLRQEPTSFLKWKPNLLWAFICSFLLLAGLSTLGQVSEFLYFNF